MNQKSDSKLLFIKFARVLTYLVYAFFIIATVFLTIGFFLLLFGANPDTGFVKFIYHFAAVFLQPFRDIFPGHQLSDRSYFSGAALFAIIMYGLGAIIIHSLITYITLKQTEHLHALNKLEAKNDQPVSRPPQPPKRPVQ